ncbi:MAG: CRISPR-associated endonuclease Cas2 [Gammaproteobacteria bacterium]
MPTDTEKRRWYLVNYDIRDPKRWRRAYKTLQGRGERIQYSLFRCRLDRTEMEALRWELEKILEDEDDLLFVHLCPSCAARVKERGSDDGWHPPKDRFDIL